MKFDHI